MKLHERKRCISVTQHKSFRLKVATFILHLIQCVLKSLTALSKERTTGA